MTKTILITTLLLVLAGCSVVSGINACEMDAICRGGNAFDVHRQVNGPAVATWTGDYYINGYDSRVPSVTKQPLTLEVDFGSNRLRTVGTDPNINIDGRFYRDDKVYGLVTYQGFNGTVDGYLTLEGVGGNFNALQYTGGFQAGPR